jgi:hypothetical protein
MDAVVVQPPGPVVNKPFDEAYDLSQSESEGR